MKSRNWLINEWCTSHATILLIIIAARSASATLLVQVSYAEFYSRGPFTAAACSMYTHTNADQNNNTIQQEKEYDDECLIMLLLIQLRWCYQLLATISSCQLSTRLPTSISPHPCCCDKQDVISLADHAVLLLLERRMMYELVFVLRWLSCWFLVIDCSSFMSTTIMCSELRPPTSDLTDDKRRIERREKVVERDFDWFIHSWFCDVELR